LERSFSPGFTASLMTLPSPKVTVEEIGTKGVAQAAEADPLALVFLPEGSPVGGLFGGQRALSAVLFIACVSNGWFTNRFLRLRTSCNKMVDI
jgi:hypothetical protein